MNEGNVQDKKKEENMRKMCVLIRHSVLRLVFGNRARNAYSQLLCKTTGRWRNSIPLCVQTRNAPIHKRQNRFPCVHRKGRALKKTKTSVYYFRYNISNK